MLHTFTEVFSENGLLLLGVNLTVLVKLSQQEKTFLFQQDPLSKHKGGFQALLVKLQTLTNTSGLLYLSDQLLERIQRYAFSYGQGGWENRLMTIFSRTLGPKLLGKKRNEVKHNV